MKTLKSLYLLSMIPLLGLYFLSCNKEDPEPVKEAASLALTEGGGQSAIVNTMLPDKIVVVVKDQFGNAFQGAKVDFTVTEGTVSSSSGLSDALGKVEVSWTIGATVGEQTLTVKAFKVDGTTPLQGSPLSVKATATPEPPYAASLVLLSGNNQETVIETALPEPIVVIVKDQNGNPFQGATVSFGIASGQLSASSLATDAEGKASTVWTLGSAIGAQDLTVSAFLADGVTPLSGAPLTVSATAIQPQSAATSIAVVDPGTLEGVIGTALNYPIEVILKDQNEMPFQGATVLFSVAEGSVSASSVLTDEQGKASVIWTLGPTLGQQNLTVEAFQADGTTPLEGSPLTITANGVAAKIVTDIQGNEYRYVTIGTQTWMAGNLKVTKYNDGTDIPLVLDEYTWINLTTPAYCWYENNEDKYKDTYGALYNWFVVSTEDNGGKNVCPVEWHVPSITEWLTLIDFAGGNAGSAAATKLKEKGYAHWYEGGIGVGTDEYGFTALPAGLRWTVQEKFQSMGYYAFWWTSTKYYNTNSAYAINLYYEGSILDQSFDHQDGLSIRCIKD